jgi:1-deoxypentalenic acid 11beta-hydroxylase
MPATNDYGRFRVSNDTLHDFHALEARFEEDGYLFFRGLLDLVDEVKRDFVGALQRMGAAKPGVSEPISTGMKLEQIDDAEFYGAPSVEALFASGHNLQLFKLIFGESVFVFRSPTVRYALPDDPEHVSPPHQDYFFVRINRSFRTLWIPLMDIDEEVGGLAIAPGSHKRGLVDHVEADHVYSYVFRGRKQMGIPLEEVPKPWLTAEYHAGDLLVFHNLMVHWALPNMSDRIRLSIDNRCQPMHAARTWQAERTILEARQFRNKAQKIAFEEGASPQIFEEIMIELMARGLEPERDQIRSTMIEFTGKGRVPSLQK